MTIQEKKEYLWRYKGAEKRSKELEEELHTLKIGKINPHSVISGEPSSSTMKDMSDYVAAVDALERKIMSQRLKCIRTYTAINDAIELLNDEKEKRVLRLRYLRCMGWEEIVIRMDYAEAQVYRIHGKALRNIIIIKNMKKEY